MDYRKPLTRTWDLTDIGHANNISKQIEKDMNDFQNDTKKEIRLARQECKVCMYYRSHVGGSAMTFSTCRLCGKDILNSSTCTDKICPDCAKKHKLCAHCGDDINNKPRKKL